MRKSLFLGMLIVCTPFLLTGCGDSGSEIPAEPVTSASTDDGRTTAEDGTATELDDDIVQDLSEPNANDLMLDDLILDDDSSENADSVPLTEVSTSSGDASSNSAAKASIDGELKLFQENYPNSAAVPRRRWQAIVNAEGKRTPHGQYSEYYEDGKTVREEGQYDRGDRTGEWKRFYENGQLAKRWSYRENKLHGQLLKYTEDGLLNREENYQDGLKHGDWTIYADDGKTPSRKWHYNEDVRDGKQIEYHDNGNVAMEFELKNGKLEGPRWQYSMDGAKAVDHYHEGVRHGKATSWNAAGTVMDEKEFEKGRLVRSK
ncbi:MAG: toxin-antitoxin system YwqK family antitoxin [Planctomycetales bacterium]|nr:toxin-antitoxin system YwqK family antitoxin [Planctomycetales bacterium]